MLQPVSSCTLEPVLHNMRSPTVTTTESLYATAKTQCSKKKKKKIQNGYGRSSDGKSRNTK